MGGGSSCGLTPPWAIALFFCLHVASCSPEHYLKNSEIMISRVNSHIPNISPSRAPEPLLPLLASPPLQPFSNKTQPKLSGLCTLNFTAAESMMSLTSIDCLSVIASFLSDVVCCPQLHAVLVILIGQYSKRSNLLALNEATANHCLLDVEQILAAQGASNNLRKICSIHPSNLTEATCPVKDVNGFEGIVDSSKLVAACEKIDPIKECCDQTCQNAISEAAKKIASRSYDLSSMDNILPEDSARVGDCKSIVMRWLASRLNPSRAKDVLRVISNCNVNQACPLNLPGIRPVAASCRKGNNQTTCCNAMRIYMTSLQTQSFTTNLQALNCATSLGMKLQKENVTENVYSLCHITLKDFSVQASNEATLGMPSGCLLPSLPSDITLDKSSGVSFVCDLNDHIPASWPDTSQLPASACNKTVKIPALPAVASSQIGLNSDLMAFYLLLACSLALTMLTSG